jgi:glycosyltransferase involved in cell wall biosynthesis
MMEGTARPQPARRGEDAPNESPTMVLDSLMERDPLAQIRSQTAAVIPAYQDEKHIGDIVRRTRERLDHVLVIDDGSSDPTAQRAREAGAEVIVHDQNRGKGEAIKTGLGQGIGREVAWVILLDSDGQHLPEEIDRFLSAAASATRPTFFIGNRMNDVARMPFIRRVVNRCMSSQISRLCGQRIPDTQCGFRMVDRQLIPELLGGGDRFDYETEVLIITSRKGYRIESVPITTVYTDQVSKIHPVRDAIGFLKLMWRYRKLPHAAGSGLGSNLKGVLPKSEVLKRK